MSDTSTIIELDYWGIYDRGVPNQERIVFKPVIPINLSNYLIAIAIKDPVIGLRPFYDHAFFFPDVVVSPPSWVFVYTCAGTPSVSTERTTNEPIHSLFWGKEKIVFGADNLAPVILRIDGYSSPPEKIKRIVTGETKQKTFPWDEISKTIT